ncbi:hypothetical protein X802_00610 [Thermococcus guaymasensis DSM 11113]|uniref:Uncharacterized protein n=1 Tax=Thermococcus guaymasensis DSM 11113 TaxID=1432656 RepID=A0A0X1KMX5_9EURY|nr:hypothetical protein X802_00610 [Thermococcus guaymasensis DSM 11113]
MPISARRVQLMITYPHLKKFLKKPRLLRRSGVF